MNRINWKDEFNIGIPEIDQQHQSLMEMINTLITNFTPEATSKAVQQMVKYADNHFQLEEALMTRYGYDQLNEHKEQHLIFRQKVSELAKLDFTKVKNSMETFNYLCAWLTDHILTMDLRYKDCFLSAYKLGEQQQDND